MLKNIRRLTAMIAAVAAVTIAPTTPSPAADGKLIISNWDGYSPPDLIANFTRDTGIEAEMVLHATNEEIVGKLTPIGGKGYDVVFVSAPFVEALNQLGLLAELDPAKIPNLANLYPEARNLAYDPGNKLSAPYAWGTTGLCYRSDVLKAEPTSWMDLLKPAEGLKRRVTMLATERWLMGAGLKALGHSINSKNADEVAAAKDLLIAAKKDMLAYDDTTFYQKLLTGDADLVHAWDGWCNYGIAENDKIKFMVPKEGSDMWVDTMVVMAASENKDAAYAFINYVLQPDVHRWAAENILYKVPNQKAMEALDKGLFEKYPNMAMTPADLLEEEQIRDLGEAQPLYSKTVTEILAAQ
jgi:spermidine/putrescine transport system substrate-binding protein